MSFEGPIVQETQMVKPRSVWGPIALLPLLAFLAFSNVAYSQWQPTPEQMRLINQLPPSQRQQALEAVRQIQSANSGAGSQTTISEPLTDLSIPTAQSDGFGFLEEPELRAGPGSRLVIHFDLKSKLDAQTRMEISDDPALGDLEGSHFYELDESGVLVLQGLASIPLLGLTEESIVYRLGAEPSLRDFDVSVFLLDAEPIGIEALKPFGYDIFESDVIGFEPATAGPVPPDYILGPGDSVRVQLFGNVNNIYEFEVSRDGVLNLPELGPITVAGLPFSEFRDDLNSRVQEMLIGTQVSVTMGQLRTIRIFVLGDVNMPGSYVVSSLATISSALYRSGGVSRIGTLRDVQLKRQGQIIRSLDLYDLLIRGDTASDQRLQPGDAIFVPPIGNTVAVSGAVKRPAIYEMKGPTTVSEAIRLAGGLRPEAYPAGAVLERIDETRNRIVESLDASSDAGGSTRLRAGDVLSIPLVLQEFRDAVLLEGHVNRPGPYQWRSGMRLIDLIGSERELAPGADANYLLVRREDPRDRSVSVLSANLQLALRNPGSPENLALQERDTVYVFSLEFGRQRVIEPILEQLELQARYGAPYNEVQIAGVVRAPGVYPYESGMRISDLIRAGGSLAEGAYSVDAELTRFTVVNGEYRTKEIVDVKLGAIVGGDNTADILLMPHDHLNISLLPDWKSDWSVTLEGEVLFPGVYQVVRGETLSDVIQRAGGLTEYAFPEGAIFLRESLREREREQIDILIGRMEADLAALSLQSLDTTGSDTLATGQALLNQLRNLDPVGRLVIDVNEKGATKPRSELVTSIELKDGDELIVPTRAQEVTVIGEVQYTTSHLYQSSLTRDDYIALSGGLTRKADKKQIYIVRASGAVVTKSGSKWFKRDSGTEIRPGDTIVVPLDTDRMRPLTFWTSVTQILYQGAIAVAAVKTFDN